MTTGRRYGGPEAVTAGIVDTTAAGDKILDTAVAAIAKASEPPGPPSDGPATGEPGRSAGVR